MTAFTYSELPNAIFLRSDGHVVRPDPNAFDYKDFLAWRAAGNVPTPYVDPVPVLTDQEANLTAIRDRRARVLASRGDILGAIALRLNIT